MTTRMLIDARHAEETRVAVLQGNRIEEFDFESAEHKQIKGNIYLAKVTRVEPSLQAAFVDFGGNRHGFLAFSEIHPDYYQIPKQDREALLAEEAAQAAEEEALRAAEDAEDEAFGEDGEYEPDGRDDDADLGGVIEIDTSEKDDVSTIEAGHVEGERTEDERTGDDRAEYRDTGAVDDGTGEIDEEENRDGASRGRQGRARSKQAEELRDRRMALRRRYKIQDVIQRRQVLLVQVVKEERGNKGAALTTYLSLAGRYCVLMPNSSHGGGISRKISSAADRKRLKSIIGELELPRSMGCIVRTAGLARTKSEIKRDFDYLARLWDEIREKTLGSSAPALIHSDSDLIKRAIRDIYNRDIEDVVVEGEHGFHAARAFMKLLMPSHAKKVKAYADPVPLFQRYGAEDQLTAMYDPIVQLRSGGYIVINPTEALVSIDINSGRSTKEYGIEATALNTNLEAAREIARQLRLRDMAGLVVIDFIDMEHGSNVRKVEKAMKDALRNDRARIQVGRISGFGLMEMSRQRLRTGVLEASTRLCPHCDGSGLVRTASSAGLAALRLIEDEAAKGRGTIITLFASTEASIYLLNVKRVDLGEIEYRYGVRVEVIPEGENEGAKMRVGSSGPRPEAPPRFDPIVIADDDLDDVMDEDEFDEELEDARESGERSGEQSRDDGDGRRKRRKRRRGRDREDGQEGRRDAETDASPDDADEDLAPGEESEIAGRDEGEIDGEAPRKRRRRGRRRRGGRGRFEETGETGDGAGNEPADDESLEAVIEAIGSEEGFPATDVAIVADDEQLATTGIPDVADAAAEPVKTPRARRKAETASLDAAGGEAAELPARPARARRKKADVEAGTDVEAGVDDAEAVEAKPKRVRRKKTDGEPSTPLAGEPVSAQDAPSEPPSITSPPNDAEYVSIGDAGLQEGEAPSTEQLQPVGEAESEDAAPTRRGWWQRTFGA